MRLCSAFALLLVVLAAASSPLIDPATAASKTQDAPALPAPSSVVKPHTYASLEPVPRGTEFQIAVIVEIARGFHMNSHKPTDAYLIPTTLTAQLPAGFRLIDTLYPAGRLEKFAFSPNKPLDVYTEKVNLRLMLAAQADAPLGNATIPMTLRYQACNDSACLPPVKVPVEAKFVVAAAGAKAKAVHPELFTPLVETK